MVAMLGWELQGAPAPAGFERADPALVAELRHDVDALADAAEGPEATRLATTYTHDVLARAGLATHAEVVAGAAENVVAEAPGTLPMPLLGARIGGPDVSGLAVMLAVARRWRARHPAQAARFVAFGHDGGTAGSVVHARTAHARADRVGDVLALGRVGADALVIAADRASAVWTHAVADALRAHEVPVTVALLPRLRAAASPDFRSFRDRGWPAALLGARPDRRHLPPDPERLARVVEGLLAGMR